MTIDPSLPQILRLRWLLTRYRDEAKEPVGSFANIFRNEFDREAGIFVEKLFAAHPKEDNKTP